MAKDFEHLLKCLSAITDSSVENSLFNSAPHVLIALFSVLVASFLNSLYILYISPLSDVGLVKIFSHSVGCRFCLTDCVLCFTEASQFQEVPFINCRSQCLCYWCNVQEVVGLLYKFF